MNVTETVGMREKILEEAAGLFVAQGYNGISMREIAEAAGLSKAALYYHFKDKQALMLAILTDYLDDMESWFDERCSTGCSVHAQVDQLVRAIFAQPPVRRAIIRLASQEMPHLLPEARAALSQVYHQKFIGRIEAMLQRGIDSGELRAVDAMDATWVLLGMMYPFFYPGESRELNRSDAPIELILTCFFEGMAV